MTYKLKYIKMRKYKFNKKLNMTRADICIGLSTNIKFYVIHIYKLNSEYEFN